MVPIKVDSAVLAELIAKGHAHREDDGAGIPELGSTISLWNGQANGIKLLVSCGAFTARVDNQVYLSFGNSTVGQNLDLSTARALIIATAEVWQPDWAVIANSEAWYPAKERRDGFGQGWITYIADVNSIKDLDGDAESLASGRLVTTRSDGNGLSAPGRAGHDDQGVR
jgi:hypothetical protein